MPPAARSVSAPITGVLRSPEDSAAADELFDAAVAFGLSHALLRGLELRGHRCKLALCRNRALLQSQVRRCGHPQRLRRRDRRSACSRRQSCLGGGQLCLRGRRAPPLRPWPGSGELLQSAPVAWPPAIVRPTTAPAAAPRARRDRTHESDRPTAGPTGCRPAAEAGDQAAGRRRITRAPAGAATPQRTGTSGFDKVALKASP